MDNVAATGLVALALVVLAACGSGETEPDEPAGDAVATATPTPSTSSTSSSGRPDLLLDFESLPAPGETVESVRNEGTAPLLVSAVSSGDARVRAAVNREGGHALRFPAWVDSDTAPAAVLVATDESEALDPGDRDFSFGASFALARRSAGSAVDDGNNLVQRGSYEGGQYKIQVDRRVPSCRVAGDKGEVFVKADTPVVPGRWYTVSCERVASQVNLTVTPHGRGEPPRTSSGSGPIGTISLALDPISIGGKVSPAGDPVASADQFNGVVDDVFVQVD